jgi:hypothetical protein
MFNSVTVHVFEDEAKSVSFTCIEALSSNEGNIQNYLVFKQCIVMSSFTSTAVVLANNLHNFLKGL